MHNGNKPNPDDLPTTAQLIKSTILAAVAAVVILVAVVLPSEYGIDPSGFGKTIGLVEMGQIKTQLAEEAEADRQKQLQSNGSVEQQSNFRDGLFGYFVGAAYAQTAESEWTDKFSITLAPSEGVEVKLAMEKRGYS